MQKRINLVDIERIQSKTNLKQLSCEKSALDLPKFGSPPTQINSYADAGDRTFGAKMPTPFFFMASAFFFAEADFAFLPAVRLMAVSFFNVAFVGLVVFTFFRGSVFFLFLFFPFRRLHLGKSREQTILCGNLLHVGARPPAGVYSAFFASRLLEQQLYVNFSKPTE